MKNSVYTVGSRQSDLAMVQTQWALQGLTVPTEIKQIISTGDRVYMQLFIVNVAVKKFIKLALNEFRHHLSHPAPQTNPHPHP